MIYFITTANEKLIDDYIWYNAYVEKYQPPPKTKLEEFDFYVLKASIAVVHGADVYDEEHTLAFAETKEELLVFAELHNMSMKKMHLDEQEH